MNLLIKKLQQVFLPSLQLRFFSTTATTAATTATATTATSITTIFVCSLNLTYLISIHLSRFSFVSF